MSGHNEIQEFAAAIEELVDDAIGDSGNPKTYMLLVAESLDDDEDAADSDGAQGQVRIHAVTNMSPDYQVSVMDEYWQSQMAKHRNVNPMLN